MTVAVVNDKFQLQDIDTYMDPLQMFRRIAPNGIVNKHPMNRKVGLAEALDVDTERNEASTAAMTAEYPSSGEPKGASLPVTACPVLHVDSVEGKTDVELATALTDSDPTPIEMEFEPSAQVQSSSMTDIGDTGSQSSETMKDETASSSQPHKSMVLDQGSAHGMDVDSRADSASKEDTLPVSDTNAGAPQEVGMIDVEDSKAAAVSHDNTSGQYEGSGGIKK